MINSFVEYNKKETFLTSFPSLQIISYNPSYSPSNSNLFSYHLLLNEYVYLHICIFLNMSCSVHLTLLISMFSQLKQPIGGFFLWGYHTSLVPSFTQLPTVIYVGLRSHGFFVICHCMFTAVSFVQF